MDPVVGRGGTLFTALDRARVDAVLVGDWGSAAELLGLMPRGEVEEMFVMDASGLLVSRRGVGTVDKDANIFSGMLSAIQDFTRLSSTGDDANIQRLEMRE